MQRSKAREIAISISLAACISEQSPEEALESFFEENHYASLAAESELYSEFPESDQLEYIKKLVKQICDARIQIDSYISKYSNGWKVDRLSKTTLGVLRCAIAEILYFEDIPNAVAINEAVEILKHYEEQPAVAFANGVLGAFVRGESLGAVVQSEESLQTEQSSLPCEAPEGE